MSSLQVTQVKLTFNNVVNLIEGCTVNHDNWKTKLQKWVFFLFSHFRLLCLLDVSFFRK